MQNSTTINIDSADSAVKEPTVHIKNKCVNCRFFESYAEIHADVTQPWELGLCEYKGNASVSIDDSCNSFKRK